MGSRWAAGVWVTSAPTDGGAHPRRGCSPWAQSSPPAGGQGWTSPGRRGALSPWRGSWWAQSETCRRRRSPIWTRRPSTQPLSGQLLESRLRDRGSTENAVGVPCSQSWRRRSKWKRKISGRVRKVENGLSHIEAPSTSPLNTLLHPAGLLAQQAPPRVLLVQVEGLVNLVLLLLLGVPLLDQQLLHNELRGVLEPVQANAFLEPAVEVAWEETGDFVQRGARGQGAQLVQQGQALGY